VAVLGSASFDVLKNVDFDCFQTLQSMSLLHCVKLPLSQDPFHSCCSQCRIEVADDQIEDSARLQTHPWKPVFQTKRRRENWQLAWLCAHLRQAAAAYQKDRDNKQQKSTEVRRAALLFGGMDATSLPSASTHVPETESRFRAAVTAYAELRRAGARVSMWVSSLAERRELP